MGSLPDQSTNSRRRPIIFLLILGLFVTACLGGVMYLVGDLTKFQAVVSEREARTALRDVTDPEQLDHTLKRYPSNKFLRMLALASNDAVEIDAAAQRLLGQAEPRALPKLSDLSTSSLSALEAIRRDLETAEGNAPTAEAGYVALVKTARDKVEMNVRSLNVGDERVSRFMSMIDEQHTAWVELVSKTLASRAEYDSAYEKCVALLVRDFGAYKVTNGQFVFPFQSSANALNRAAAAMAAAAKRIAELDDERSRLMQSRLSRWKALVEN